MSTGQILGGGLGAVIGGILAAPTGGMSLAGGAALGFQIGMTAGGYLDPPKGPTVYGPRLDDKSIQTGTYGTLLTRFYGTVPISGNITWLENNQLKETVRKKKQGGKGGGSKTTVKTYSYSATFILSLGIGPIAGVRRIWCSDRLIYNAGSDDLETIIASNQAATGFKLYLGSDDQLPDPRYEADVGVGNAPAYRGEAYIAFYDFELADYSNTLQAAQFKVEVVTEGAQTDPFLIDQWARPISGDQSGAFAGCAQYLTHLEQRWFNPANDETPPLNGLREYAAVNGRVAERFHTLSGASSALFGLSDSGRPCYIGDAVGAGWMRCGDHEYRTTLNPVPGLGMFRQSGTQLHILLGALLYRLTPSSSAIVPAPPADSSIQAQSATLSGAWGFEVDADGSLIVGVAGAFKRLAPETLVELASYPFAGLTGWLMRGDGAFWIWRLENKRLYRLAEDFSVAASWELAAVPTLTNTLAIISDGAFVIAGVSSGSVLVQRWAVTTLNISTVPLAEIVEREIELSSLLSAADVDTSLLTAEVRGYRVSGGSIRSALEPLQGAFPFDIIQSGYQIKCVPRGLASVMTIPWEHLGATDDDTPGPLLQEAREMDSQLPALVSIKYLDAAREYATGEQSKARINTQAINRVDRELPIVLNADEAAGVADVLVNLPWLERTPAKFSLPPPYLALEPADVVTVVAPWATYELRLSEGNYAPSGRGEWDAKPNHAALYTSTAKGGEGVPPAGTIALAGPTLLLALDIPVVDETLQNAPGFAAVALGYTPGWPGAVAFRTVDSGQTWTELQGFTGMPTLGNARGTLPASACTLIDQRTLVVDLLVGDLESITRDQLIAGHNYAAYGVDGRWEIVRFQNAVLQADGSYLLSGFVRGDRGTEWATGLHQAGDYFVLLDDPDTVFIDMAVGSIGVPAIYRGVTAGASIDSAPDVPMNYQGVNLECLSPVAAKGSRDGSGNFSGSFVRRSRLSSSWWTTGVSAPVGETAEAYEIDVMSGATVKRTLTTSSPAFSYSAADQVSDFGSAQSSITFRIYQLSGTVGRGYPLEVTL